MSKRDRIQDQPIQDQSRYPAGRVILIAEADIRSMTVLEVARAAARARVSQARIPELMAGVMSGEGLDPDEIVEASILTYALTYELERRLDPEITWEEAQRWDVKIDKRRTRDRIADAEAEAAVRASFRTGLPPSEAGELTVAELAAYDGIRDEQDRALAAASRSRSRRGRRR